MKTKILNALKTEYAKMGLGDKAFDGVASFLVKTITKDEEIDGVIKNEDTKNLLKAFQGESDSLRNRNAQLEKDFNAYKQAHPEEVKKEPEKEPEEKEPEWARRLRERFERQDREDNRKSVMAAVIATAKTKGCTDDRALKLTEKLFELKDDETSEAAASRFEASYNENFKEYFGGGQPPFGGPRADLNGEDKSVIDSRKAWVENHYKETNPGEK